jgi:hypothetical protein
MGSRFGPIHSPAEEVAARSLLSVHERAHGIKANAQKVICAAVAVAADDELSIAAAYSRMEN